MFDSKTTSGEVLKQQGMQLALDNSGEWKGKALEALKDFIESRRALKMADTFSMDLFRYWLKINTTIGEPKSLNAWGGLTNGACKKGLIVPTNNYVLSLFPAAHKRPIRVWMAV